MVKWKRELVAGIRDGRFCDWYEYHDGTGRVIRKDGGRWLPAPVGGTGAHWSGGACAPFSLPVWSASSLTDWSLEP